ncbi:hypothetical protein [Sphingomicrobium arenosum]|uniref:hypothetical protein n=1 Tax=Sphingomicrobium arenosum TaxID=2233861 RepID=UPI002240E9E5|nr:hypothetical protein [Sphingomicrobium arenosum]
MSADLSGRWTGAYFYGPSMRSFGFTAQLRDAGGALSLLIDDDPSPLHRGAALLSATASGSREGSSVRFTKIYDDLVRFPDPVHYEGEVDADEAEIAGRWSIRGVSGTFIMTRPRQRAAVRERAVEELLPR